MVIALENVEVTVTKLETVDVVDTVELTTRIPQTAKSTVHDPAVKMSVYQRSRVEPRFTSEGMSACELLALFMIRGAAFDFHVKPSDDTA